MKRFTILLIGFIFSLLIFAQQEPYSKVKVFADENQLTALANAGIDVTEGYLKKDAFLISDFSQKELQKIKDLGITYEILIEDVIKYYVDKNIGKSTNVDDYKGLSEWEVPDNFEFGSMGGHATFDEIIAHLDNMATLFPELVTIKQSIGQSIEGRELWMVKISDNPEINETEPEVLYTALHHAREPAGAMTLLFYMYYLLENYDIDPFIQLLVDNSEMYFVPVVNPDGYVYNQSIAPYGGGMWRKNRRNNGVPGCDGVDLNRNYGYMWGLNNSGSSSDPCDETYRGASAFSEPETVAVRDFCEDHEFKFALNYHTYGNWLLYTWGYTATPCPDDGLLYAFSSMMTIDNNYTFGPGYTTIYETNGGSDDWMYGEQLTKPKTFSFTPELGGSDDGFWCPIDRIIPIAQENMIQNILVVLFSGIYASVEEISPTIIHENTGYITFELTRLGLEEGATYTVSLEPISEVITSAGQAKEYEGMEILETITDSIDYTLLPWVPNGTLVQFVLTLDNGAYQFSDTITKVFGEAVTLFEDDCNTLSNWTSSNWNVTTSSYYSPPGSITDSPFGDYSNYQTNAITMMTEIDLENVAYALLNFMAKWEIEEGWDYVQLLISTNGGGSWVPLEGKYTVTGNSYQASGEPLYDGFQTSWAEEEIDLSDYIGNSIKFRYLLKSDSYVTEDGFYFDDFKISIIEMVQTGVMESTKNTGIYISSPIPNPATKNVEFILNYPENNSNLKFHVFNTSGLIIYSEVLAEQKKYKLNISDWNTGIYYYYIEGDGARSEAKKLVIIR